MQDKDHAENLEIISKLIFKAIKNKMEENDNTTKECA